MAFGRGSRHASCSTRGRRTINEDRAATLVLGSGTSVAAVADGMGGVVAGDVASEAAMTAFLGAMRTFSAEDAYASLCAAFEAADDAVRGAVTSGREGMGTTLVAAVARGTDIWIGNVGDSRAVLVLPDEIVCLSTEHSLVSEALRGGRMTELEALRSRERHVLSRALGDGDARPDVGYHSMRNHPGATRAMLLVGSDGLFNFVGETELIEISAEEHRASRAVENLVRRAIENGSDDNVSAAALVLDARPSRWRGSLWAAAVLAFTLVCGTTRAQQIESITGKGAILSEGSDAGVRKGMTGKFCVPETVGGRTVPNCSALFVIVSVSAEQSVARVTKGIEQDVHVGAQARFDVKLSPRKREARNVPPKEPRPDPPKDSAAEALRWANQAFQDSDYRGALERYENFLRAFPKADGADQAAERAEQCRSKLAAMAVPAPSINPPPLVAAPPPPAIPTSVIHADALTEKAEALFAAGNPAEARRTAVAALIADSTSSRAQAVLSAIRTKSVQSRFNTPTDVAVSPDGICYVADSGNNTIRRVSGGATTTIAGSAGQYGFIDGHADRALFNDPTGVAVAADGSVYVADQYNAIVRRLSVDGTVTTFAGRSGLTGTIDGAAAAARFSAPRRVAVAADGSVYIADAGNHAIRRISAARVVETIVTANALDRMDPAAIAVDPEGNVFVADSWSHVIRRIGPDRRLSVFAGVPGVSGTRDGPAGNAQFNSPEGIAADRNGNVYVSDSANHTIRKIASGVVTTVAGDAGLSGAIDGIGSTARLNHPSGIACDAQGRLWIADSGNHTVRVLTAGFLETVAGLATVIGRADGTN